MLPAERKQINIRCADINPFPDLTPSLQSPHLDLCISLTRGPNICSLPQSTTSISRTSYQLYPPPAEGRLFTGTLRLSTIHKPGRLYPTLGLFPRHRTHRPSWLFPSSCRVFSSSAFEKRQSRKPRHTGRCIFHYYYPTCHKSRSSSPLADHKHHGCRHLSINRELGSNSRYITRHNIQPSHLTTAGRMRPSLSVHAMLRRNACCCGPVVGIKRRIRRCRWVAVRWPGNWC